MGATFKVVPLALAMSSIFFGLSFLCGPPCLVLIYSTKRMCHLAINKCMKAVFSDFLVTGKSYCD